MAHQTAVQVSLCWLSNLLLDIALLIHDHKCAPSLFFWRPYWMTFAPAMHFHGKFAGTSYIPFICNIHRSTLPFESPFAVGRPAWKAGLSVHPSRFFPYWIGPCNSDAEHASEHQWTPIDYIRRRAFCAPNHKKVKIPILEWMNIWMRGSF